MRSGTLNKSIIIESLTTTQDSFGDTIESWSEYKKARAAIKQISSKEYFGAQKTSVSAVMEFKIRYIPGIIESMRINYKSKYYDIESIDNINEKNRNIVMLGVYRG